MPTGLALVPLGEFLMGAEAFGVVIDTQAAPVSCLAAEPVFVGQAGSIDPGTRIDQSADGRFLILPGAFTTFVVDRSSPSVSMTRHTLRASGLVCEETPIWGETSLHVRGRASSHFVQFPFLADAAFLSGRRDYELFRLDQIRLAKAALR